MNKKKGKELLKVLGISALSIGLFSASFVGINTLAFAAATGTAETLPPAAAVVIPGEQAPPSDFVQPRITVNADISWSTPSANALSPEDAAQIGAQYIWAMFGESIDGMYVSLLYTEHPAFTRAYWMGTVSDTAPRQDAGITDFGRRQAMLYSFTIDAVTGEWIGIFRSINTVLSDEAAAALNELERGLAQTDIDMYMFRSGGAAPTPEQLDRLAQIAREHAARHFAGTEVVSVEFTGSGVSGIDLDEDGSLIATSRQIMFEATDNTGRVAELSFDEETGVLFRLSTQNSDFVPGFRFEDDGRGIG